MYVKLKLGPSIFYLQQSHIDPEALLQIQKPSGTEIKLCSGLPRHREMDSQKN